LRQYVVAPGWLSTMAWIEVPGRMSTAPAGQMMVGCGPYGVTACELDVRELTGKTASRAAGASAPAGAWLIARSHPDGRVGADVITIRRISVGARRAQLSNMGISRQGANGVPAIESPAWTRAFVLGERPRSGCTRLVHDLSGLPWSRGLESGYDDEDSAQSSPYTVNLA
jgi:hypothetical protein